MNVYDFDKTVFVGDTEERFFAYVFKKPGFFFDKVKYHVLEKLYQWKLIPRTPCREMQYRFLKKIDDIDSLLEAYWDENEKYMMSWYLKAKRPDDIIATGTPAFLMLPILKRLELTELSATDMDKKTGKIHGSFAIGPHKVTVFGEKYRLEDIDNFYSDAYSDHFLAEYAKAAFLVTGDGEMTEWNEYFSTHPKK